MSTEYLPSIESAKANCEEHQALQARLPLLRETLGKEVYRAEAIESCLDEIQKNLDALHSLTPISLIKSLVGRKQRCIDNAQNERESLQSEMDLSKTAIVDLERQIKDAEAKLVEREEAEKNYDALIQQAETAILAQHDDRAEILAAIIEKQKHVDSRKRAVERTIQSCKHVMQRLDSMSGSLHRARNKTISRRNGGAIFNAATRQIAQGSVNRTAEGFTRLASNIEELCLTGQTRLDDEILQVGAEVAAMTETISQANARSITHDHSYTHRYLDGVQQLMGLLKDKHDDLSTGLDELDKQRRTLVDPVS